MARKCLGYGWDIHRNGGYIASCLMPKTGIFWAKKSPVRGNLDREAHFSSRLRLLKNVVLLTFWAIFRQNNNYWSKKFVCWGFGPFPYEKKLVNKFFGVALGYFRQIWRIKKIVSIYFFFTELFFF